MKEPDSLEVKKSHTAVAKYPRLYLPSKVKLSGPNWAQDDFQFQCIWTLTYESQALYEIWAFMSLYEF